MGQALELYLHAQGVLEEEAAPADALCVGFGAGTAVYCEIEVEKCRAEAGATEALHSPHVPPLTPRSGCMLGNSVTAS